MTRGKKILLFTGIGTLLYLTVKTGRDLYNFDQDIEITLVPGSQLPTLQNYQLPFNLGFLNLPLRLVFNNPLDHEYVITKPYIQVLDGTFKISETSKSNENFVLRAKNKTYLDVTFNIDMAYLKGNISDIYQFISNLIYTGKIGKLNKTLLFNVDITIDLIPINKKYNYTI